MKHTYFKSSKKEFKDSIVNQNENHEAAGLRHLAFEVDDLSVAIDELDNKVMQQVSIQYYSSPCGEIILASVDDELCLCDWNEMPCSEHNKLRISRYMKAEFKIETSPILELAKKQLNEYFTGNRKTFDIPLHPIGTDFQKKVWSALLDIPYGETRSYKEIAISMGNSNGTRAVASAIGANGISIFIPCHRVIGSNRSLTGFAGGLEAKRILLELETE